MHGLWTVGLFLGPMLVLLPLDLRERGMLGDTGSNAIGAMAGIWLVVTLSTAGQAVALGIMALVTVYGEFRSISALIVLSSNGNKVPTDSTTLWTWRVATDATRTGTGPASCLACTGWR